MSPKYDIAVGRRIRVLKRRLRTDGLMDTQEFTAVVTLVTPTRFEYRVDRVIGASNVLYPVTEGGWSRLIDLETLRTYGMEILP